MSNPTVSEEPPPKTSSELSQQPQMPRRAGVMKFIAIFCVVILVALVMGFAPRWFARSAVEEQTNALSEPTVNVLKPQTSTTESELVLPADLRPYMEAPIYARINGYLKRWVVDIGTQVKAGDLLAEIDAPEVDQQARQLPRQAFPGPGRAPARRGDRQALPDPAQCAGRLATGRR
ncbi:MAG: efflux RND transporter periplasmic adaptor subunit [Chthoniobacteraceae bacterium]